MMKIPKLDMAGAAAALKNIPILLKSLQSMGKEFSDIGQALGALGGIVSEMAGGSVNPDQASKLKENIEEITSSKKTIDDDVAEIKRILDELTKAAGDDKQSKIARVIDATLKLLELVSQILDALVQMIDKVEKLKEAQRPEEIVEMCAEIGEDIKSIIELVKGIKDQVEEIVAIAKGEGGGGGGGKDKSKDKSKDKAVTKQPTKADGKKPADASAKTGSGKDKDEKDGGGCCKCCSCCCCCCGD
jgi:hypothetical protein